MSKWPGAPRSCEGTQTSNSPRKNRITRNHDAGDHFGDHLPRGNKETVRILLHNPGGIGFIENKRCLQTLKMEKIKKFIIQHNVDIVGLSEVNKDWRRVKQDNTIWNTTKNWREHRRVQVSQNKTSPPGNSEFLVGGTAMAAFDDVVFKICEQGEDFRHLGRWSYITIAGKNNMKTTIFTCYCPNHGKSPGSTYSQHLVYMSENVGNNISTTCPRQLFGMDLKQVVEDRMNDGHQVILLGDFNTEFEKLTSWMHNIGLQDLIQKKHGDGPDTHMRSKSKPIDRIFGSPHFNISYGGFLSYSRLMSDHRGVWIDIPKFQLFGYNPPEILTYQARRLKMDDPRVVQRYLDMLFEEMDKLNLFEEMEELHRNSSNPLPTWVAEKYEEIDAIICKLMTQAEKKCRKLHTGTIKWSPEYQKSCLQLLYWLQRRSYLHRQLKNVRKLLVLQKKLKIQYDPGLSIVEIEKNIVDAAKQKKLCKVNAESNSLEYRTQLALAKENAGEIEAATYIRTRNNIENQRKLFRNIRHMEGKIKGGFTSKLEVTTDGTTKEFTEKNDIENLIIKANEEKYHQTEGGSQLLQPSFAASLGAHGEGPEINKVLDGTYTPPPNASVATSDFLTSCKIDALSPHPSRDTPVQRFFKQKKSWKTRKEKTCTYNHHIGHFKSIFKDKRLSWLFFQRADIPEISGYSPRRHRTCIDLQIMKKTSCFDVGKQRTIGILDTEFNQSNKRLGRDAMTFALRDKSIAAEQFAIKNVSAIDQVVSKRCMIDHHKSKRKCFSLCSSDLAGCYDRIVHTAAALALLRVGISHTKIHTMFSTIQRMTHKIRTAYGDSNSSYGGDELGDWKNFPQGVLQGNASGPTIWALLSSIIFDCLHKRGFGTQFCTSLSKQVFCLVGFAYVDDCDLVQSGTDPIEVLSSMQQLINSWGTLMEVTGGALSVEKSWFYLVDYVWSKGKWTAIDAAKDLDLVATSADGNLVSLKRLYADNASEMLGVWIAPSGNQSKLIQELQQKAMEWGARVRLGNPSQEEAWHALHCTISAKLKYALPSCTLSKKECASILFPAIKAALPRSGICSRIPTAVRECPIENGGLGVLSLYHWQGTSRTSMLVEQLHRQSACGMLLLQCVEDMTLETGLYGLLWNMPFDLISKYISNHSLIYHILEYNSENNISISIQHKEITAQRKYDKPIMVLASSLFTKVSELRSIQRVRMKIGVTHLSDICTAQGTRLDSSISSTNVERRVKNDYAWPSKHHLNAYDIFMWRKLLKNIFSSGDQVLQVPLGAWNTTSQQQWIHNWDYFVSDDRQFLYMNKGQSTWHRFLKKPHSHRAFHTAPLIIYSDPTDISTRVSVTQTRDTFHITSFSSTSRQPIAPCTTIHIDQLHLFEPKLNWFMSYLTSSESTSNLLLHLNHGTAIGVSDGSYYMTHNVGSCAWIISSPDGSEWVSGGGLIPGNDTDQNAYRSEIGGLLGLTIFLHALDLPPNTNPSILIACDGKSALRKVITGNHEIKCKYKDIDMISIMHDLWKESKFIPNTQHVYGHQDVTGRELTMLETLNCKVDLKAKEIALNHISDSTNYHPPSTTLGLGSIYCNNSIVTSKIRQSLYNSVTTKSFISWLSSKNTFPVDLLQHSIHWPSFHKARKNAPLSRKIFITKWLSDYTASGEYMVRTKMRKDSSCPKCNCEVEDLPHILTCTSTSTRDLHSSLLKDLHHWLKSSRTLPSISTLVHKGIKHWLRSPLIFWRPDFVDFLPELETTFPISTQLQIGWYNLLCGFLSTDLVNAQQQHFIDIESKRSITNWAASLITKLWDIIHKIWCHRNSILHETTAIHNICGLQTLIPCIEKEYILGHTELPHTYSSYFHKPLTLILAKPVPYLKKWFLIIRTAREAYDPQHDQDQFSSDSQLRKWIGLSPLN